MEQKLVTPFTKDQVNWLEDQLTSLMTQHALAERLSYKLKMKCLQMLTEIKENVAEQGGGKE